MKNDSGTSLTAVDGVSVSASDAATARHTEGPWRAYVMTHAERGDLLTPEELGEYVKNSVIESAVESGSTEFVFISADKPDGPADVCHVGNGPTRKANAHLIAAAPEMYEALKALTEAAEFDFTSDATDDCADDECVAMADGSAFTFGMIRRARAILAKSEGR